MSSRCAPGFHSALTDFPILRDTFSGRPAVASFLAPAWTPDCDSPLLLCSCPPCLSGLCCPLLSLPPRHLCLLWERVNPVLCSVVVPLSAPAMSHSQCGKAVVTLSDIWAPQRPRVETSFRPRDFSPPSAWPVWGLL